MNRTRSGAIRMLAICAALSVPGLAGAENVLDKLNEVLQHLPKPPAATQTAPAATPVNTAMSAQAPAASATPEGVKALIAATPAISAGPFYLGMPADKAIAQMKSSGLTEYDNEPKPGDYMFQIRQVPGQTYVGGIAGDNRKDGQPRQVRLLFTMYPNPPVVTAIWRSNVYADDQGPTVSATLAALRKKYGQESYSGGNNNTLYWVLDGQGDALSPGQVNRFQRGGCAMALVFEPGTPAANVANGLSTNYPSNTESCRNSIWITARLGFRVPGNGESDNRNGWDRVANGVLRALEVTISDRALHDTAVVVSHEVAVRGLNQQTQQQIQKAKQRGGPNL